MKYVKTAMILAGSLTLAALLALAGCGEDHGDHFRSDRDRYPEQVERHDSDRHEVQPPSDRHDDHGGDSGHEGDHGGR
jgi:hypothetical protein